MPIININNLQKEVELNESTINLIEKIVKTVLNKEKIDKEVEVGISIVNNAYIKELNNSYRNINEPTDVLSFPLLEAKDGILEEDDNTMEETLLGDIVISIDKVIEQSKEYEHSVEREIGFLVCHGMYHLLGYDHILEADEKVMLKKQEDILNYLELKR